MADEVHIVAASAITAVGLTPETTAAAIRAGISRIGEHPFMVDGDGDPLRCAVVPSVRAGVLGAERLSQLGSRALSDALERLNASFLGQVNVLVALPEDRPGFRDMERKNVLRSLSDAAAGRAVVRECARGHAGAALGLQRAVDSIAQGVESLCIVGGVDGYFEADTLDWLDADLRLARASRRGGFPPGEGAAFVVLTNTAHLRPLQLRSLGIVQAVACAHEQRDETAPEGPLGEALSETYFQAGAPLMPGQRFDDFYCDINDERARTTDIGFGLLRAGSLFRDGTAYVSPVGSTGDIGAATLPLNCILATRAWSRGYANGPTALIGGGSWTGMRGAVVVREAR